MTRSHRPLPLFVLALGLSPLGCGGTPTTSAPTTMPEPTGPKAVFPGGTERNAGEVDFARAREFTFPVANAGDTDLELKLLHKSCTCADVQMPDGRIPAGGTGQVVIRWSPIPGSSGPYAVTADVQTNDPKVKSQRLVVNGHVKPLVRVFLEGREARSYVDFGDEPIPPGGARVREVTVFSTELPAFGLDVTSTQPGLDVSRKAPLREGARLGDYEVRSGYTVEIRTTDKLPLGYVRADLNLTLSKLGNEPDRTITVPVYAVVGNGVCAVSPPALAFSKPTLTEGETARVNLVFIDPGDKPTVAVESYEPKYLKVDAPDKVASGRWQITAHLPTEASAETAPAQADGFMEGQVALKVSGLDQPVKVRVKWAPLPKK